MMFTENTKPPFTSAKRALLKNFIEDINSINKTDLLNNFNKYMVRYYKTPNAAERFKKYYGLTTEEQILSDFKTYILFYDLELGDKYGLKEILQWEHLVIQN